jgi:hypothetical protein
MRPETFNLGIMDEGVHHIALKLSFLVIVCKSYWKLYHWISEHECGARMMVLGTI